MSYLIGLLQIQITQIRIIILFLFWPKQTKTVHYCRYKAPILFFQATNNVSFTITNLHHTPHHPLPFPPLLFILPLSRKPWTKLHTLTQTHIHRRLLPRRWKCLFLRHLVHAKTQTPWRRRQQQRHHRLDGKSWPTSKRKTLNTFSSQNRQPRPNGRRSIRRLVHRHRLIKTASVSLTRNR